MKKRLFLSAVLLLIGGALAMAQISTGEPSAVKVKTGNRPDKGTFGLYVGGGMDFGSFINRENNNRYVLPLVNLKYYFTDKVDGRIGLDFYRHDINIGGKKFTTAEAQEGDTYKYVNNAGNGNMMLWPGIAYHFTNKNILDVYVGAELPIGLTSASSKLVTGDPSVTTKRSMNAFNVGLGAFVGLQAFIGNLPLAIGLEYGLYGAYSIGNKVKNVRTDDNGKKVWYESLRNAGNPGAPNADNFEKLHVGEGYMGNQLRLTLSYYFK